jgi:hypothetical protein
MQSDEIIRDLQSVPTPAMLHAADSRSRDCGNDGFFLQSAPTPAILRAVDSRSRDRGNDGFLLFNQLFSCHPGNFVAQE